MKVAPPKKSPMNPNMNKRMKTRTVVTKRVGRPWATPRAEATTNVRAPRDDAQKIHMKVIKPSAMAALIAPFIATRSLSLSLYRLKSVRIESLKTMKKKEEKKAWISR